jgi:hypothetical protein
LFFIDARFDEILLTTEGTACRAPTLRLLRPLRLNLLPSW